MLVENLGLAFDLVVAALLVVVIGYAFVLNRKLTVLREGKEEMARLAQELGDSLGRAQSGLEALKAAASGKAEALQTQLDRADTLADDLAFLVRKSDIAAQKLDRALARSRNPLAQDPASLVGAAPVGGRPPGRPPVPKANRVSPPAAAPAPGASNAPQGARPLAEKLLEAQKLKGPQELQDSQTRAKNGDVEGPQQAARSEEETMLLKVLQGMR